MAALPLPAVATPPDTENRQQALAECKIERGSARATRSDDFTEKYGTNRNNRNAFGRYVSKQAKGDA